MFDFLVPAVIFIPICLSVYKTIELYAKRKERILFLEKMIDKMDTVNGNVISSFNVDINKKSNPFITIRWAAGLLFFGLGLIIAHLFCLFSNAEYASGDGYVFNSDFVSVVYMSFVSVMMGLGFLVAFFIEMKYRKKMN